MKRYKAYYDRLRLMLGRFFKWAGWPGTILSVFSVVGLSASALTFAAGAPLAGIPILDLIALILAPFPTLAGYSVSALLAFLILRPIFGMTVRRPSTAQWAAGTMSIMVLAAIGIGLPKSWNAAVGLQNPTAMERPRAVTLPKGGDIALIEEGYPEYVRCGGLCLSLLLQGQAHAVEVAATMREPGSGTTLSGSRFMLTAETRQCLSGKRDYGFRSNPAERHEDFIRSGDLPIEYDTCLDRRVVTVDPSRQTTLVEWIGPEEPTERKKPGYSRAVAVIRTQIVAEGQKQVVREARFRSGWKYDEPLSISPYAGNAGTGTYFSPSVSISYFRERGYPDVLEPRMWALLKGSEELGEKTASWLDTVVKKD